MINKRGDSSDMLYKKIKNAGVLVNNYQKLKNEKNH